ncbi:LytTR family DNA-binding domain-containing protein [Bacteroides sp. 14(A)]|uniref:LytR/AlgR family response regulator transcription factor n=1 Tax=Bacteroides sp. 14(A) TaxID=1163670 RepID=UPI0004785833|nr:LytTR family DNA-binding domain-containing protein [Bacteroides sp. 14(A)]
MDCVKQETKTKVVIIDDTTDNVITVAVLYGSDYLLEVIDKLLKVYHKLEPAQKARSILYCYEDYVFIRKGYGYKKVAVRDIFYLEADRNYCNIYLFSGECLNVSIPMSEVMEYLSPEIFKRIHRSFMVNLEYVDTYIGNMVVLKGGKEIVIGREYREEIRKEFVCIGSRKRIREKNK